MRESERKDPIYSVHVYIRVDFFSGKEMQAKSYDLLRNFAHDSIFKSKKKKTKSRLDSRLLK